MFNNLIESSSHRSEFRRRGSFFLITTASYTLFFVLAGVASIYAYDARMEDQNVELATIMPLVELPATDQPKPDTPDSPDTPKSAGNKQSYFERKEPVARVDEPAIAPINISTTPNPGLPRPRDGALVAYTGRDRNPGEPGGSDSETGNRNASRANPVIVITEPPAPPPIPKPVPQVIRKRVINGDALVLPKPQYPALAKQIGVKGTVNVQVLIDEKGNVVSATPVSGHPLLVHAAKAAAFQARFSPTFLGDQPVKVSGVITYNFVLQ